MEKQGVICVPPRRRLATLIGIAAAWTVGCAGAPAPQDEIPSAESYYERGLEVLKGRRAFILFRDIDYVGAIELFQEVIDNYPYSEFATLSELKIADVYFDQRRFEEAANYYQDFVDLHPTHPRVSYAVYQRGLCGFSQMHASDQDQTPT
ncbi:MAG: outer membrane protein assembly factor BamD, partial [Myxococcota bacterium]